MLCHLEMTRYPLPDQAMFLLSSKADLRATDIAAPTWAMDGGRFSQEARKVVEAGGVYATGSSWPDM